MDSKKIANLMGVSLRGVEEARYRLRKKLGLDNTRTIQNSFWSILLRTAKAFDT